MEEFKHLRNQIPPHELFHYTNIDSFLGIIANKELWLSNNIYSNDFGEFEYPRELLLKRLEERKQDDFLKKYNVDELKRLLGYMKDPKTCVFSMSSKKDQLSQWRGYANSIPGYCLGINSAYFNGLRLPDAKECFLCKCVYRIEEQLVLIDEIISDSILKKGNNGETEIAFDMLSRLVIYSPVIKRPDFEEEDEWRFIISRVRKDSTNYFFRVGRNCLQPYYKLKNIELMNFITQVIIGANPKMDLNYESTYDFCEKNGLSFIPRLGKIIEKSKLSYRNW